MPFNSHTRYELRKRKAPEPIFESSSSEPSDAPSAKRVRWGPDQIRHFVDEPYEGPRTCFVSAKIKAARNRQRRVQEIVKWALGQGPIQHPAASPWQPPSLLGRCIDFVLGWFQ
jgi:hypothetical protein